DERDAGGSELEPGAYVTISVTDTGMGMPPDVVARAFDPFFTTKPLGKGTGLGLPMVYGFARQSGGTARIESAPGAGTTVRIWLPRSQEAPEGTEP
ncbi:ATP-binding protein, partial [Escherichia coli]